MPNRDVDEVSRNIAMSKAGTVSLVSTHQCKEKNTGLLARSIACKSRLCTLARGYIGITSSVPGGLRLDIMRPQCAVRLNRDTLLWISARPSAMVCHWRPLDVPDKGRPDSTPFTLPFVGWNSAAVINRSRARLVALKGGNYSGFYDFFSMGMDSPCCSGDSITPREIVYPGGLLEKGRKGIKLPHNLDGRKVGGVYQWAVTRGMINRPFKGLFRDREEPSVQGCGYLPEAQWGKYRNNFPRA
ncbi:hypothetical protein GOBAR_DD25226 [Gossypium barbadense]|nr:hypothetical protein GOBAR_DD25226 [Gossypium barbadense]